MRETEKKGTERDRLSFLIEKLVSGLAKEFKLKKICLAVTPVVTVDMKKLVMIVCKHHSD